MRRTGSHLPATAVLLLAASALAADAPVVTQEVDRTEVGTDDIFVLTVRAVDAPAGSSLQLPDTPSVETIGTSRGVESSVRFGGGGPRVQQISTLRVRMRALKPGKLVLPPAELHASSGVFKSQSVTLTVKAGHVPDPSGGSRPRPDPFGMGPFGGGDDAENPFDVFRRRQQAAGERDLFLRGELDKKEVYQGEQATLSLWIYARVDLSRVDAVTMPRLDGFWTEDVDTPKELTGETRTVDGVPYRAYLLRRLALFPVKSGAREIGPVEADITTGFLFAGRREHRASQPLTLKVKPLPAGAPAGFQPSAVGTWALTAELTSGRTELGTPVTLRLTVEGRGNVKDLVLPRPVLPPALKLYEPTSSDKTSTVRGRIQGRRTQEFLVLPQQTGTFEIPALELAYFDPETQRYERSRTGPLTLAVVPGAGGSAVAATPGRPDEPVARNVLNASALRPLRISAALDRPPPPWRRGWFLALLALPPLAFIGTVAGQAVQRHRARSDPRGERRRCEQRARGRLAALQTAGPGLDDAAFSAEVDGAVAELLSLRLGLPVTGLTREALRERLATAGAPPEFQARVRRLQDTCDEVRFAPGASRMDRAAVLADAEALAGLWEGA
ncbi:MAG TPA: BatD family protein [Myxococcaceae bacterium]|nr:BatD family protein [Myxococcaceae bacterium]